MSNALTVIALLAVGVVWGILLTYSHSLSFAEYLCRNCEARNKADATLAASADAPDGSNAD